MPAIDFVAVLFVVIGEVFLCLFLGDGIKHQGYAEMIIFSFLATALIIWRIVS